MKHLLLKAILRFCTNKKLFKYFRRRYNKEQLEELNNVVKIRGKIRTVKLSIEFLKTCQAQHVILTFMSHRIKAAKVRQTSTMERAFLLDEISRSKTKLESFRLIYLKIWSKVRHFLSFFDWIRFCRYLANIEQIKQKQIRTKHFNTINWLRRQRFGSSNPSGKTICNLSSYNLSETEKFILAYGLEQGWPNYGACAKRGALDDLKWRIASF